jgi:ABC-type branched-subunit amino acid transport system substrate-binding protein
MQTRRRQTLLQLSQALTALAGVQVAPLALAQKKYDTGASDTEIKVGHIIPYSGPASAYGTIGKSAAAYFAWVNDQGGINGRRVNFISLDDGYSPPKTVEMARRLVEQEEVLLLFGALGTAQNTAIVKYMNAKKVPHLFLATGATKWGDYKTNPWTMGWQPTYQTEGQIYAQHVLQNKPNGKIAILYQNDDFGKDYLKGFLDVLGDKAKTMIVQQATYEVTDPTIDSQLVALKASGADVFLDITTPKFAAMAVRKVAEIGWKPTHYLASVSQSIAAVLKPAGFDNARGVISCTYMRDPSDPETRATPEFKVYETWFKKYYPDGDINDTLNTIGYSSAQTLHHVLKTAGDNLTRENVMRIAANLDLNLPMLAPGIRIKTSPTDFYPIGQMQPVQFDGQIYRRIGGILGRNDT